MHSKIMQVNPFAVVWLIENRMHLEGICTQGHRIELNAEKEDSSTSQFRCQIQFK